MSQKLSKTHSDEGVARIGGGECHDPHMKAFLQTLGGHPSVWWRNILDTYLEYSRLRYL